MRKWLSLSKAAESLGVSDDTILRRAVLWQDEPMTDRVRFKYLKLGKDTRRERRYWFEDTESPAECPARPKMGGMSKWLSLSEAAAYLDVSDDTILRRKVEWQDDPVPNRIRFKWLKLDEDTRRERRYWPPDLEAMLVLQHA